MSPGRLAGRPRPRVSIAVASMRARGCLRLCSPRTVSAAAELSLSPGTRDPVAGLVVRLLEAPHRSGRQRTVPPIDGPRRESRLGQATLDRPHPLRSVGLEVSGSRSQRSAGERPPGMLVRRCRRPRVREPPEGGGQRQMSAGHSGHPRDLERSLARRAGAGATAPRPIRAGMHNRLRLPARPSERRRRRYWRCCVCCLRCVAWSDFRWPPAPRLASARCRWRSPPMPRERVTSCPPFAEIESGGAPWPRPLNDRLGRAASQERQIERYTARASPTPMPSADASSAAARPPWSGTAPLLRTERSHQRHSRPTPRRR